jgi:hypothetical protein
MGSSESPCFTKIGGVGVRLDFPGCGEGVGGHVKMIFLTTTGTEKPKPNSSPFLCLNMKYKI